MNLYPKLKAYVDLTKPRLVALVMWSVTVGFMMAPGADPVSWYFILILTGVGLVAAGSLTLNQWIERSEDSIMARTQKRALPSGRAHEKEALILGLGLSLAGCVILWAAPYKLSLFLTILTWVTYLFLYTPLKKITTLNTLIGALPGALPPMVGWVSATGHITYEAWVLFAILFLWQLPHFLALSWMYRDDYAKADFVMLPIKDSSGQMVARQAVFYCAALLPVSLMPSLCGMTGWIYFVIAFILGTIFLIASLKGLKDLDREARSIFKASLVYLSVLLLAMVIDKV